MAYTTPDRVTALVGGSYAAADLSASEVAQHIATADGMVDSATQDRYFPFNGIDSTKSDGTDVYNTPPLVVQCASHLAAAYSLMQVRVQTSGSALMDAVQFHLENGNLYLNQLRDPRFWLPPHTFRNETLTFGDSDPAWGLSDTQAFMATTSPLNSGDPPHIFRESVRISSSTVTDGTLTSAEAADFRYGRDYRVRYEPRWQRTVFEALTSEITDHITTLKVTYNWDYRRARAGRSMTGVFHA